MRRTTHLSAPQFDLQDFIVQTHCLSKNEGARVIDKFYGDILPLKIQNRDGFGFHGPFKHYGQIQECTFQCRSQSVERV